MKNPLLLLTALASLTIANSVLQASPVQDAQVAQLVTLITSDAEKARGFVMILLKRIGDNSGVADCSVFVKKTVGPTDYWVAKAVLADSDNVQAIWRVVLPMDLSNISIVPDALWPHIVATHDNKAIDARVLNPND